MHRTVLAAVACGGVLLLAACGGESQDSATVDGGAVVVAHGSERYPNTTASDWVTYADHVVVATAIDDRERPLTEEEKKAGEGAVDRIVTMSVEKVVWSSGNARHDAPSGTFEWNAWGWALQDGERIPMVGEDSPRVEVGHTYVMALVWRDAVEDETTPVPARWVGLGSDAVIPFDNEVLGVGEFQGSIRSTPVTRDDSDPNFSFEDSMAGRSIGDLVAALKAAPIAAREDYGPVD